MKAFLLCLMMLFFDLVWRCLEAQKHIPQLFDVIDYPGKVEDNTLLAIFLVILTHQKLS